MNGTQFEKKSFSVPMTTSNQDKNAMNWEEVFGKKKIETKLNFWEQLMFDFFIKDKK